MVARTGRPPKPTNLKVLHGDRKDRINTAEPVPSVREVVKPADLEGYASDLWDRLAPDHIAKKVLTAWDADLYEGMCRHYARWREAEAQVDREGITIEGAKGGVIQNPAYLVAKSAWDSFARTAARFGMTPADRSQLKIEESPRGQGQDLLTG